MFPVMILSITGEILQNTISYVIYCLVMISVMILSITGSILQKYYFLCYLLFSDVFSDDSIHHWLNFTKYNFLCYLLFSDDFSDEFIHHWLNFTKILFLMLFIV